MSKFKIKELAKLTDAYKYTGEGFVLKIIYGEDDDKYIEIEGIKNDRVKELEEFILKEKESLLNYVSFYLSTLNEEYIKDIKQILDNINSISKILYKMKGED